MTILKAIEIIEGDDCQDVSEETLVAAWQFLIDTGTCWQLQGWYGREAIRLIREGICIPCRETNDESR